MSVLTPNAAYEPTNPFVNALLTDQYQLTMTYAYYQAKKCDEISVFEVFFRKSPFMGEFAVFAGLDDVLRFLNTFGFTDEHCELLKARYPTWDPAFWTYLRALNAKDVVVHSVKDGSVVFPRIPLLTVRGPLVVCQLIETTLLTLVNFPSLVTTNAARHRIAIGPKKTLLEFGLRRAQGPDGGMTASKYAYIGSCDGTSNVLAALQYGIPLYGTHAHSFVTAFSSLSDLHKSTITDPEGKEVEFVAHVLKYRQLLGKTQTHEGELAAFIAFAQSFPASFVALIDTYDTLQSGVWNYLATALALYRVGYVPNSAVFSDGSFVYVPKGVRIDSGDLAYLSLKIRAAFVDVSEKFQAPLADMSIIASNDLSEHVLHALQAQPHSIDTFAVGTHLVTCKDQPALGCVYKCVELNAQPRMKLSEDHGKLTIPGEKRVYRLKDKAGVCILDLMCLASEEPPAPGVKVLCRHPFDANKRVMVTPTIVEPLHYRVWDGGLVANYGADKVEVREPFTMSSPRGCEQSKEGHHVYEPIDRVRARVSTQLGELREDHLRAVNPTPYKLSVSCQLYDYLHRVWLQELPIRELE